MMRFCVRTPLAALILAYAMLSASLNASRVNAQTPPPKGESKTLIAVQALPAGAAALLADSIANAGDSLAAYAMLASVVRTNKRNASAWHQYGMLAWSMARASRGGFINRSPQSIRWLLAADSALHLSVTYAPDSAAYWRDLARFYLNSGSVFQRFRSEDYVTKGLAAAARTGDSILVAELADERGMVLWRRYETVAFGALEIEDGPMFDIAQAEQGVKVRRDQMIDFSGRFMGFADYTEAMDAFMRANKANPLNARARRHVYMAQAERKQWPEMLTASNRQLLAAPWDWEAWLARGLASERLNKSADAAAAFDSAMAIMPPEAVASYTRMTRIMPSMQYEGDKHLRDSATFSKLGASERNLTENLIWAMMDPLAITPENEYRTEFYARVAFADLRWTSDDLDYRGANTDRGDIHVRYGPPDRELSIPGADAKIDMFWRYNNGLTFHFAGMPTFGTAYAVKSPLSDEINRTMPVVWDNVPVSKLVDTMPVRTTAFRGTADSLDIVLAANIPAAKMLKNSELGGIMPFNLSSRVIDGRVKTSGVQSTTARVQSDSAPERLKGSWTQRVGPGVNIIRVDAYQPDTRRIAKGLVNVDPVRPKGFGMSDVLIGTKPAEAATVAERWRDVKMQPTFGTFHVGESIGLVWENYELTPLNGDVKYRVNITVEPISGEGLGGVVARVRSAIGNALLGQSSTGKNTIDVSFPRTAPAREVTVESMSLDMGTAKPGVYRLKVEVSDLNSQAKTVRITQFEVVM